MRTTHLSRTYLALTLWLAGCGAPAAVHSPSSTAPIAPLTDAEENGVLIVAVLGYPRDIEYRVNGVRVQTAAAIPWWSDARLELELEPGKYKVEATYRVRAFSGDKTTARVATPHPVAVRAGSTTYLLADLDKDWLGMPASELTEFRVVDAATFAVHVEKARTSLAAATSAGMTPAGPDSVTVLRGSSEGVSVTTQPPGAAADSPSIVIRGNEVLPPDGTAPASSAAPLAVVPAPAAADTVSSTMSAGLPPAAGPEPQALLEPGATAPAALTVRLQSEPAGARVFVDEREVGVTPLEVRIAPTVDHVIRFERNGCSDHVRFLSAAGWEAGRSSTLVARLECAPEP